MKKFAIILLLLFLISLSACKKEKTENKEPPTHNKIEASHLLSHEDIESSIHIIATPELKENRLLSKYSIATYMKIKRGLERNLDFYQFDWTYDDNTYETYQHTNIKEIDAPFIPSYAQQFLLPMFLPRNDIISIQGMIKYSHKIDLLLLEKSVSFQETIFKLTKEDFHTYEEKHFNPFMQVAMHFLDLEEEEFYRFKLSFTLFDPPAFLHLDIQSWIVTEEEQIFPFIGIYNYTSKEEHYETLSDVKVYKYVNIKDIYIKCINTTNNNEEMLLYKMPFKKII